MGQQEIYADDMLVYTNSMSEKWRVKTFLDQWIRATTKYSHSDTPEQDALLEMVAAFRGTGLAFEPMPIEWAFIDDERFKEQYPSAIPIIMHQQASRQIRAEEFRRDKAKRTP